VRKGAVQCSTLAFGNRRQRFPDCSRRWLLHLWRATSANTLAATGTSFFFRFAAVAIAVAPWMVWGSWELGVPRACIHNGYMPLALPTAIVPSAGRGAGV
jgi:hypothetical protein